MGPDPEIVGRKRSHRRWPHCLALVVLAAVFLVVLATIMRGQLLRAMSVLSGATWPLSAGVVRQPRLRFTPEGTFQITIFNDLHLGEGEDNRTPHTILGRGLT
jgi:hypothetical protein